jgi:cytoskeletal protein RodZ
VEKVDQTTDSSGLGASMRVELGMLLRQERLKQQKEISDVAKRLILSPSQVLNLEAGAMDSFHHERRYVHALKGYLFYLGLSSDLVINDKLQQLESASLQSVASSASGVARLYKAGHGPAPIDLHKDKKRSYRIVKLFAAIVVLLLVASLASEYFNNAEDSEVGQLFAPNSEKVVVLDTVISPPARGPATDSLSQAAPSPIPSLVLSNTSTTQGTKTSEAIATPANTVVTAPEVSLPLAETTAGPAASSPGVPAAQPTAGSAADPFANLKTSMLRIAFVGECWASLITTDGSRTERIFQAGQSIDVELDRVTSLTIGNSSQAKLQVGTKPLDLTKSGALTGNVARLNQAILQKLVKQ